MKKRLLAWFLILLLLLPVSSAFADEDEDAPAWQAYNGKRLGVLTGTLMEDIAYANFPDSEYLLLNSYPDCIAALLANKIDAYLGDEPSLKTIHAEQPRIDYIHERITNQEYSFAFRKDDPDSAALCAELNAFLSLCQEDGTMQELDDIWFGVDEERKVVDMSDLTGENGTIRVVTTSTDMPFSYIKEGKNVGYDIDLVVRFCRYAGYQLELGDVDFAARIPAIQSGKYDFTTDMNVTPERQEQVLFSDPTSTGGVVLAILADGDTKAEADPFARFEGKTVGVQTGTISGEVAEGSIAGIQINYYNTQADAMTALRMGKVDAWATEDPTAAFMLIENEDLVIFPERLDSSYFASVFAKTEAGHALCDEYSAFVDGLRADGTLGKIKDIWFGADDTKRTVLAYEALPAPRGTLHMAVDTAILPFAYVKDDRIVGYDVDIAARFCEAKGYGLEIVPMDFGGILPSVQSGKCDFSGCGITITEERAESVLFSSATYDSGTVLVIRKEDADPAFVGTFTSLDQLDGKRIGVQTGSTFDQFVLERLPHAQISYFNTYTDLATALLNNKIDGFPGDEPVFALMAAEDPRITWIREYMDTFEFGYMLPKTEAGDKLLAEINEYLSSIRASGELEEIQRKWTEDPEEDKTVPDHAAFPAPNGILTLATEGEYAPMDYVRNGVPVGMEIDLTARFCEAYGYGLKVELIAYDGIQPSVMTGKVDFAAAGFSITPERAESINFSDPYYSGGTVMAVLKAEEKAAPAETATVAEGTEETFWESIRSSFNKTFIRESRWKLFLEGIGNTMLITLLAILLGTALGFAVFMACRNGNMVANGASRFSMWLVQGMPMVVLLMILYYIIFGSVAISGITVAVIGFTLTFGAAVFGMLKMGVGAVDKGQYEAAYALGHSNRHTFFKIILPQAIPHVLPAYQGEIVGLIKATAIVGYIAVQDLTKMGDIVRSRTYEAFFPLIAIAVIYFILEGLFSFVVSRICIRIDPKKRRRESILKGVNTHD